VSGGRIFAHHRYTRTTPFNSPRHLWELVGPKGALSFSASFYKVGAPPSCGLEFHHLSGDGVPDHIACPLTGGWCWHTGTSLYASEHVWPEIEDLVRRGDHDSVFEVLEGEYRRHFEQEGVGG
jgi:hypothetical protein